VLKLCGEVFCILFGLLIRVEDTGYVTIEYLLTNLLSLLFRSFVLLFLIVLRQLCLLHEVKAIVWPSVLSFDNHHITKTKQHL